MSDVQHDSPLLSRRGFLASASAFAATTLVACGGGGGVPGLGSGGAVPLAREPDPDVRLGRVQRADFERLVGSVLAMRAEGSGGADSTEVVIVDVIDRSADHPDAALEGFREPFTVSLRGPADGCSAAGRYVLTHPATGDLSVYVCYGGIEEEGALGRNAYLVYFN